MRNSIASLVVLATLGFAPRPAAAQFNPFSRQSPFAAGRSSEYDRLRNEAQAAYEIQDYNRTVDLATRVIEAEPQHPLAYYYRGSALVELGARARSASQIRKGIADGREALRLGGKQSALLYIPYLYGLTKLSDVEGKPEHAAMAITVVSPVLEKSDLAPGDKAALFYQRALAQMEKPDYKGAAADFASALALKPDFEAAYYGAAQAHTRAGEHGPARANYDRAVEMFPRSALALNERGAYLQTRGELDPAIRDFTRAIQLDSRFAMARTNRGLAYARRGSYAQAEPDYAAALAIDLRQPIVHRFLGAARLAQGKLPAALDSYNTAVQLAPQSGAAYADRGIARFCQENYQSAIVDFDRATELEPWLPPLGLWRYWARVRGNEKEAAEKQLREWLGSPRTASAWMKQMAQHALGELDDAALLAAADAAPNAAAKVERKCEAQFAIAQRRFAAGEEAEGTEALRECLATKAMSNSMHVAARYALKEFAAKPAK